MQQGSPSTSSTCSIVREPNLNQARLRELVPTSNRRSFYFANRRGCWSVFAFSMLALVDMVGCLEMVDFFHASKMAAVSILFEFGDVFLQNPARFRKVCSISLETEAISRNSDGATHPRVVKTWFLHAAHRPRHACTAFEEA